jgi:hypothetical protein
MAYAPVGDGGLVAIGDSDLWSDRDWDYDSVIGLDEYDNAVLARRVFARHYSHFMYDAKTIQVSQDGGAFKDLGWSADGPLYTWLWSGVPLADYAGSTVRIRFHFATVDGVNNDLPGWFVDDVWVGIPERVHLPLVLSGP